MRTLIVIASLLGFAAAALAADKPDAYARRGRALYVSHCVACHGASGQGDGPVGPMLKIAPADLTNITQKYSGFPAEKIMIWIDGEKASLAHGTREMPVWGTRLRHERSAAEAQGDVYALTRYLQTIQK